MSQDEPDVNPTEQRGGTTPGGDHSELGSSVLGETTGSEEPATDRGVDTAGGEGADAVTDGGAPAPPPGHEPDLKDAAAGPRAADRQAAEG